MLTDRGRDSFKLWVLNAIPDRIAPEMKGRLLVNAYLTGRDSPNSYLAQRALNIPGARRSILAYLSGSGSDKLPGVVGKHLGDHWYTAPAKLMSQLPLVNNIVLGKISDKIMPELHGTKDIAAAFSAYGGMV